MSKPTDRQLTRLKKKEDRYFTKLVQFLHLPKGDPEKQKHVEKWLDHATAFAAANKEAGNIFV